MTSRHTSLLLNGSCPLTRSTLAFTALQTANSGNHKDIETTILTRYDVTEEAYRRQLHTVSRTKEKTNRELAVRQMDLQAKWLPSYTSVGEMAEVIGLEQFLNTLPRELRVWVIERKPKTCVQAGGVNMTRFESKMPLQKSRKREAPAKSHDAVHVGS